MSIAVEPVTADEEFARLFEPFRRELLAHCYRMLGSFHEAEDLAQETYMRAWQSYDRFEGRSSLRVWLYRIATNVCLRAIERGARRVLPSGLGAPETDPHTTLEGRPEVAWLQPLPGGAPRTAGDPADLVAAGEQVRLAFVAALQWLPASQRAVLLLRDVVGLPAAEVAEELKTSRAAVNSLLQRARARLAQVTQSAEELSEPGDAALRARLDRYVAAFHNADVAALAAVLREDVSLEMPPLATWFAGRPAVLSFFASQVFSAPGRVRLVPVTVNGQPAFASYLLGGDGMHHAHGVHVLDIGPAGIGRIYVFMDPALVEEFGLPPAMNPAACPDLYV